MALKAPYLLDLRHKKGRPWTPLDVYLVELIPPSHNWSPAFDVVRPVVCATNLVPVYVGECHFDQFGIRAVLV